jgi:hypothetical protein
MSVWISALKEYNAKKGMWCMPKKGTAEHAEVTKIMDKLRSKSDPEAKAVKAKAKAEPKDVKVRKAKVVQESESDSDVPVAKPKVRDVPEVKVPKAKAPKKGTVVVKDKFVPTLRTAKEKEEHAEKMELEMMAEDFKAGSPLKKKTSGKK